MQHEQFAFAVRFWKPEHNQPPDIVCVCRKCLAFVFLRDVYSVYEFVKNHLSFGCPAIVGPNEIPDLIEKALATRMQGEPPAPPKPEIVTAVEWVLKDAGFKAPEEIGPIGRRWIDRLAEAYKK